MINLYLSSFLRNLIFNTLKYASNISSYQFLINSRFIGGHACFLAMRWGLTQTHRDEEFRSVAHRP